MSMQTIVLTGRDVDLPAGDLPPNPLHAGVAAEEPVMAARPGKPRVCSNRRFLYLPLYNAPSGGLTMPYRWKKKIDVDETIVVIKNVLDREKELPNWLVNTIYGAIRDSDPDMAKYFYAEVKKYVPAALKYFEEGSSRSPI